VTAQVRVHWLPDLLIRRLVGVLVIAIGARYLWSWPWPDPVPLPSS
jgi:uncharacterized membrane protein YfcA